MAGPTALIVPAVKKHTATVIVAHGLGDTGAGWMFLAENWRRRGKFEHVKFVFPNAPRIPITVNFGMYMPGWYDIVDFRDLRQAQDERGIFRSRDYLAGLVKDEVDAGVPASRIVLGGFSQGGSIAMLTGITSAQRLAGVFGLSCYLPLHTKLKDSAALSAVTKDVPMFMGHGEEDPLVKYEWGLMSANLMKEWGFRVEFHSYVGLEHSADPKEIDDLEQYIASRLPSL